MRAIGVLVLLLAAGLATPLSGAQDPSPAGDYHAADKTGDVVLFGGGPFTTPGGTPSTPLTDFVDLTDLHIWGETEEGLHMSLQVKNLQRPATDEFGHSYGLSFRAATTPAASYSLSWTPSGSFTGTDPMNATPAYSGSLCLSIANSRAGCVAQRVLVGADYKTNTLDAFVFKSSLAGLDPVGTNPPPMSATLLFPVGARLSNFTAQSNALFYGDRLPDVGYAPPYVLHTASANQRIRLGIHQSAPTKATTAGNSSSNAPPPPPQFASSPGDFPHVSVEAGRADAIPLDVRNLNGAKRIVNLTATLDDAKDAGKWSVRVAPTLTVPGNDTRTFNLVVNATDRVHHRDSALVHIRARSLGISDEIGLLTIRLVASVPPGPESHTLFFHAGGAQSFFLGQCADAAMFRTCSDRTWANTLEQDPAATADADVIDSGSINFSGLGNGAQSSQTASFTTEEPLPHDLVFDVSRPIEGTFAVRGPTASDGTLQVQVRAGDVFVGSGQAPIPSGAKSVTLQFLPLIEAKRIPAGSLLTVRLEIDYAALGPGAASAASPPGFIPKGSQLSLPLIPDPVAPVTTARLGEAYLSLRVRGDADDFVNPGESRAFNLTVLNEGADAETVIVNGSVTQGKCGLEIRPGQRFHLDNGDGARFGVLVSAPASSKEGDKCTVRIHAAPQSAPDEDTFVDLHAVVTTGVDLRNDAENYTVDPDAASKVESARGHGRSPDIGLPALLAVAAMIVLVRRRPGRA